MGRAAVLGRRQRHRRQSDGAVGQGLESGGASGQSHPPGAFRRRIGVGTRRIRGSDRAARQAQPQHAPGLPRLRLRDPGRPRNLRALVRGSNRRSTCGIFQRARRWQEVVKAMLRQFATMLRLRLASRTVTFINGQGTLAPQPSSWHNELHPARGGFDEVCRHFSPGIETTLPEPGCLSRTPHRSGGVRKPPKYLRFDRPFGPG